MAKDGLDSIAWAGENMNFNNTLLGYGAYYSEAKETRKVRMSQLYREVYDSVISFITNDVHANFGHMKLMVGEKVPTNVRAVESQIALQLAMLDACTLLNSKVEMPTLSMLKTNRQVIIILNMSMITMIQALLNLLQLHLIPQNGK